MTSLFEHRFAIKRITKSTSEDYISALKIYNVFRSVEQPKTTRNTQA